MREYRAKIDEPCSANWDEMQGDARRRFCGMCEKHVHDISALSRREAEALLDQARDGSASLCVQYRMSSDGAVEHTPKRVQPTGPLRQVRGARRLVAGAISLSALCTGGVALAEERTEVSPSGLHEHMLGGAIFEPEPDQRDEIRPDVEDDEDLDSTDEESEDEAEASEVGDKVPCDAEEESFPEPQMVRGRVRMPDRISHKEHGQKVWGKVLAAERRLADELQTFGLTIDDEDWFLSMLADRED